LFSPCFPNNDGYGILTIFLIHNIQIPNNVENKYILNYYICK
jgi:hypothetical protein